MPNGHEKQAVVLVADKSYNKVGVKALEVVAISCVRTRVTYHCTSVTHLFCPWLCLSH